MRKKLTKEDINLSLENNERSVRMIGDYISSATKTMFTDLVCGHTWEAKPNNVVHSSSGCAECSKTKKLTKDHINTKLSGDGRGLTMMGPYTNNRTKTEFRCSEGHIFFSIVNSVIDSKSGCPVCSSRARHTPTSINQRLQSRGITIIGEFTTVGEKSSFKCVNNHIWTAKVNSVLGGNGCPHCNGKAKLTDSEISLRLEQRGIKLVSPINRLSQTHLNCQCGNVWQTPFKNILRACPSCRKSGFDNDKPSVGYILVFDTFIKYGISNVFHVRLRQHKRNGKFKVHQVEQFDNGKNARDWELLVKSSFGGNFVNKTICPGGFTETLPLHLLDDLSDHLNNFKKKIQP